MSSGKAALGLRVLRRFVSVRKRIRREPLPALAASLGDLSRADRPHEPPARLSRAVDRTLRFGPDRPTCLTRALVLYSLLREQGDPAVLAIGLPESARDQTAHAWVELDGNDIGPRPGRGEHVALARFPSVTD
jgi:transglutaminase superfamily protein